MSQAPNVTVHWIDRLEEQNRAVDPFVRLFAIYNQLTSTITILAIPVFIVLTLIYVRSGETEIRQLLPIVVLPFLVMLAVLAINAVIGMLNRASAILLTVIVLLHALGNLSNLAPLFSLDTSSLSVSAGSAILLFLCVCTGICFLVYLYSRAFIAIRAMFRMSADDRAILRSVPGGVTIAGKIWHRLRSLPPVFEFIGATPHAILAGALAQISVFLLGTAVLFVLTMFIRLEIAAIGITSFCWDQSRFPSFPDQTACAIGEVLSAPIVLAISVALLFLLGAWLQQLVRRLLRLSLEQLQQVDPRPPVLFLRAFRDDQVVLRPPAVTFLGWLAEFGHRKTNLDRVLLEEATLYGPVVAIGKPDDSFPPYGAARGYFDNKTWQEAVSGLAHEAAIIVLCVDDTEGIWWEIEHLASSNLLYKALFIVHPRYAGGPQNAALTTRLLKAIGRDPSELRTIGENTLCLFVDADGGMEVARSLTYSRVAVILALRLFLRGKLGLKPIPLRGRYDRKSLRPIQASARTPRPSGRAAVIGDTAAAAAKVAGPSRRAALIGGTAAAAGVAGVAVWITKLPPRTQPLILSGHTSSVERAMFSYDGERIVTASADNTARLWDGRNGASLAMLDGHTGIVNSAAFSPDGSSRVVTASDDDTARLWHASSGATLATLNGHAGFVISAAFSPEGSRIVTASSDKTARLWDGKSGAALTMLSGHTDIVFGAAFSPDGNLIVTASADKTARLWDGRTGAVIAALSGHEWAVIGGAFSADGRRVVTASWDETARLWDGRSGSRLATLYLHNDKVNSAAFSPDGSRVVTASSDRTARLWDGRSGVALATLSGHTDIVISAAFSPDGSRIVTASADHTARLWHGTSGAPLATFSGHMDVVNSAAFSPDGRRVVTASRDNAARVWNVPII